MCNLQLIEAPHQTARALREVQDVVIVQNLARLVC